LFFFFLVNSLPFDQTLSSIVLAQMCQNRPDFEPVIPNRGDALMLLGLREMDGRTSCCFPCYTGQDFNARYLGYPMTGAASMNGELMCQDESIAQLTQHPCRGPQLVNLQPQCDHGRINLSSTKPSRLSPHDLTGRTARNRAAEQLLYVKRA
jgi:hypothetical protein